MGLTEKDLITVKPAKYIVDEWYDKTLGGIYHPELEGFVRDVQRDTLRSVLGRIRLMEEGRRDLGFYNEERSRGYGEIIEEWIAKI